MRTRQVVVDSHLLFERGERVLLGRRPRNAARHPGVWQLPSCVVVGESARSCAVRRAAAAVGVSVQAEELELVHLLHVAGTESAHGRVECVFRVHRWGGEPSLRPGDGRRGGTPSEGDGVPCAELAWWHRRSLPGQLTWSAGAALEGIASGWSYTDLGWTA